MTTVPPEVLAELQRRRGVTARALIWFTGRNRATGLPESLGLWTGDDAQVFQVGLEARTYYGPAVIEASAVRAQIGLNVPAMRLVLASLAAEVQTLLQAYDPRGAAVEVHAVLFDLATGAQIAAPMLRFRGRLDELVFTDGAVAEDGVALCSAEMTIVPQVDRLTVPLPAFRSDADQRGIFPGDAFFAHVATAAVAEVVVGERKVRGGQTGGSITDGAFSGFG